MRTGEILPAPPDVAAVADQLVAAARGQGIALTGPNGLLSGLTRQILQSALEAELTEHLEYESGDRPGKQTPNSRNGSTPKTVLRHSAATNMLADGTGYPVISGILGHSNANTTRRYMAVDIEALRRLSLEVPRG